MMTLESGIESMDLLYKLLYNPLVAWIFERRPTCTKKTNKQHVGNNTDHDLDTYEV